MVTPTFIIISGTVGAGKTSLINGIEKYFMQSKCKCRTFKVPEFIDIIPCGPELLRDKLIGIISPFTLQNAILDSWEYIINKISSHISNGLYDVYIMERVPIESLNIFVKYEHKKGNISNEQYIYLKNRASQLQARLEYLMNNEAGETSHYIYANDKSIDRVLYDAIAIIYSKEGIGNLYINIIISAETSMERIRMRCRSGESAYIIKDLQWYVDAYEKYCRKYM